MVAGSDLNHGLCNQIGLSLKFDLVGNAPYGLTVVSITLLYVYPVSHG